jgi:hypothetical protein
MTSTTFIVCLLVSLVGLLVLLAPVKVLAGGGGSAELAPPAGIGTFSLHFIFPKMNINFGKIIKIYFL